MRKNPLRRADIIVEDVPSPGCGPQDVLIANRASLISAGTEVASVKRNVKDMVVKTLGSQELRETVKNMLLHDGIQKTLDRVQYETTKWTALGYSGAGVAIQVGSLVDGIRVGDIVAYGGQGHAEVIRVGKNLCVRVPEGVAESHASFVAVGSIALQAVRRAEVQMGDRVVVLGLGLVGQLVCQLLQAAGARVLGADVLPQRLALAQSLGVEQTFSAGDSLPKEILRATDGLGADRVLICASTASSQVIEQAVAMARDRARLCVVGMVGLDVPCEDFYRKELDLVISRSYGPGRYDAQYEEQGVDYPISYVRWTEKRNMEEFLRLVQSGKVILEPLISHRFPLDNAAQAYDALSEHATECLAVLLTYDDRGSLDQRQVALTKPPAISGEAKETANVAVVGCGYFARQFHLPNIKASRSLHLHTLVASSAQNAKEMAARYGAANCSTDFAGILAEPTIDAVAIFTRDRRVGGRQARFL